MSIDLRRFLAMLLVTTLCDVVLSVCTGVGGCLWPISSRAWRAGTASWQFMKRAASSASAAEDMTAFMIWAIYLEAGTRRSGVEELAMILPTWSIERERVGSKWLSVGE